MNTAPKSSQQVPDPEGTRTDAGQADDPDLALPHEGDESTGQVASEPDPQIRQAKKDLDEGQVDTDMWGTPGQDHQRKKDLVPKTKPGD